MIGAIGVADTGQQVRDRIGGVCHFLSLLPARLGDARYQTFMRHLSETDSADAEAFGHAARAPADVAAGIGTHREFRLASCLLDQTLLCQIETSVCCLGAILNLPLSQPLKKRLCQESTG